MTSSHHPGTVANLTEHSLPPAIGAALTNPTPGERLAIDAAEVPWSALAWGDPDARPLLLLHGVASSARSWWRVAPALAASGRRIVAPDLPGHGLTGHWTGDPAFRDTAARVAAFARATGIATKSVQVVAHSWGSCLAAALPAVGLRPATIVLIDPPAIPHSVLSEVADSPDEHRFTAYGEAVRVVRAASPEWSEGDISAKAEALTQIDDAAARSILLDNGDWDGGLADLQDPAAAGISVFVIRGDPAAGGLMPDEWLSRFEEVIGPSRIHTVVGGPHAPQRTHASEVTSAILAALTGA